MNIGKVVEQIRKEGYKEVWFNSEDFRKEVLSYFRTEYTLEVFDTQTNRVFLFGGHFGTLYGKTEVYTSEKIPKDYMGIKFREEIS